MELGMVGLGRMGANMARRLLLAGHRVVGHNRGREPLRELEGFARERGLDFVPVLGLDALVEALAAPRAVWLMLPHGGPTETAVEALGARLAEGDAVIDGGNGFYKDDVRRAARLAQRGVRYLDVGTSGGVWGLERGYCLMIGGEREAVARLEPVFRSLAPGRGALERTPGREGRESTAEEGFLHCGPAGAGHFVKMVHNGIEYGLMQAYAEGFDVLRGARSERLPAELRYELDVADVAELWRRGSVVGSWLLDLTAIALADEPDLARFTGSVADSGEGRWTVQAAIDEDVPAHVLTAALYARFRSRREATFGERLLSALREQFGGHGEAPRS
jgi:6-phosphogluconate dehydrogenase